MSSTLGASLLRTVLSDGTLKILGSGLDKGPIIVICIDSHPDVSTIKDGHLNSHAKSLKYVGV